LAKLGTEGRLHRGIVQRDMWIEAKFPALVSAGYQVTSPKTPRYNCIAWAAGDQTRWWWPDANSQYFWPPGVPREESLDAFVQAFRALGFVLCDDASFEQGCEKVAIYTIFGSPTHAARQLGPSGWTSKLGPQEDITHHLEGVQGAEYGTVTAVLKRPIKTVGA
jgi:hypothetical protein